jgi:hypothetical protein
MKKLFATAVLACTVALLAFALASAAGQEHQFRATFAGFFTGKPDFNYKGSERELGYFGIVTGKSTLGHWTGHMIVSAVATGRECLGVGGNKGVEPELLIEVFVVTFEDTGEQLFLRQNLANPGHACRVAGVGGSGAWRLDVIGGTGRFEGATGLLVKSYTIVSLFAPTSPGRGRVDQVTGSLEGTIQLKNGNLLPF